MSESLYEKIGGNRAVEAAVDIFYRKILEDKTIVHFFNNTDMDAQRSKQISFLTMAFGGPANYSGQNLRDAHAPLVKRGLNNSHFDAISGHLQTTLEELEIAKELIVEVLTIANSTRNDVLGL